MEGFQFEMAFETWCYSMRSSSPFQRCKYCYLDSSGDFVRMLGVPALPLAAPSRDQQFSEELDQFCHLCLVELSSAAVIT